MTRFGAPTTKSLRDIWRINMMDEFMDGECLAGRDDDDDDDEDEEEDDDDDDDALVAEECVCGFASLDCFFSLWSPSTDASLDVYPVPLSFDGVLSVSWLLVSDGNACELLRLNVDGWRVRDCLSFTMRFTIA